MLVGGLEVMGSAKGEKRRGREGEDDEEEEEKEEAEKEEDVVVVEVEWWWRRRRKTFSCQIRAPFPCTFNPTEDMVWCVRVSLEEARNT